MSKTLQRMGHWASAAQPSRLTGVVVGLAMALYSLTASASVTIPVDPLFASSFLVVLAGLGGSLVVTGVLAAATTHGPDRNWFVLTAVWGVVVMAIAVAVLKTTAL